MNKWKKQILVVVIAVILNAAGRYLAFRFELPAYFDLCGTIFAAYLGGPALGCVAAILGCAATSFFSSGDWYFLIANLATAAAAGIISKKNKYFSKFHLIISSAAFFALVKAFALVFINLLLYGGRSGLFLPDTVIDYLESLSAPIVLGYVLAAVFIGFADVLVAMLLIFLGMSISKGFGKKKRAAELKKQLRGKAALGIVLAIATVSMAIPMHALAEDSISFIEKLYNSENGLTGGCLNDMAMTRDGTMWIGTYGGLFRFNGEKFVLIDDLQSVRSIQSLYVDDEDRLWAGTQDAGVTLLNIDMSWRTLDMSNGLLSNSVKCISRDSNGLYYFGTTAGIVCAEFEDGEINIVKTIADAGNIKDLSPDGEGHMIVMDNLGEISCYEKGERLAELNIKNVSPKGINHDSRGRLYIGTDSEKILIYQFSEGRFKPSGSLTSEGLKTIRDCYFEESGVIYVAGDNGIGYIDSSRHFTMLETGAFNNSIEHIFKDYQGNIWFTSSRCGLLCLGSSCFTDIFKLCNEKGIVCNAIKQWNGKLYVGSNTGLKILSVKDGESFKNEVTDIFDGIRIRCMDIDQAGNLLCATYNAGLMQITPEVSEYISPDETESMIRVVKVLSDGTVISSSDAGMVFMKDHKVLSKLRLSVDLAGGTILNILERKDGTLLCGTDGDGIALIRDGRLERYISREDGLSSGVVLRVVEDERGDGFFVLTGSGLCYMDEELQVREIGMPYYNNFDLAMNKAGQVFVLGGAGIYISDYDALMKNGSMDTFNLLDIKAGLPGSITSNAWNLITEDEHIYICGTSGVYLLDLNHYEMKVEDFKTKITSVKRDGQFEDVTQIGSIFIPKGTERVEVDLEINNFTAADPYVSYYLSGVDEEKTTVLSSRLGSVTYYDIPYGDHDFIINVVDEKGRILSTQTYVFSKERESYETMGFKLYFYSMMTLVIVFIVFSIVQGALWSQQIKEKRRHDLVIAQLEHEKAEIMQRAQRMEEDATRIRSVFFSKMSHEIRTPINAIMGMDTMIMRESGEENIRQYARDIDKAGKTLLSAINGVLDDSRQEENAQSMEPEEYNEAALISREQEKVVDDSAVGTYEEHAEEMTEKCGAGEERKALAAKDKGIQAETAVVSSEDQKELPNAVSKSGDAEGRNAFEDTSCEEKESFHAPSARVLVVDDVEMNLTVTRNLLKRLEVQIDTAMSGKECIEAARKTGYDMILLEAMLPGMNGEETMQGIRTKCPLNKDTPIIALSTKAAEDAREEFFNLGYTNYLSKPLNARKLEAMIQSYLPDEKIELVDG